MRPCASYRQQRGVTVLPWSRPGEAAERARTPSDTKPIGLAKRAMTELRIDLDQLSPADRRDLANALLQAAWRAALNEVRILLLDLLTEVDDSVLADVR